MSKKNIDQGTLRPLKVKMKVKTKTHEITESKGTWIVDKKEDKLNLMQVWAINNQVIEITGALGNAVLSGHVCVPLGLLEDSLGGAET